MGHPGLGDLTEDRYYLPDLTERLRIRVQQQVVGVLIFFLRLNRNIIICVMPIYLTRSVKTLAIIFLAAFVIQKTGDIFLHTDLLGRFALIPNDFVQHYRYWQLFTYPFLHGDVFHLFFNILMLAFIGSEIEMTWDSIHFLKYFFFCTTSAGLAYLVICLGFSNGLVASTPMVGASGGIYGLLVAYGLIFGERVLLFMMLFPMKAKHFVWVLALIELMTTVYSSGGPVASGAHVAGMAAGFLYLWGRARWIVKKRDKRRGRLGPKTKRKKSKHLTLVEDSPAEFEREGEEDPKHPPTWH